MKTGTWTEITPATQYFDLRLGELWRYRDLVLLFVRRDFSVFYKQTILGPLWYVIQPLSSAAVYLVIFTFIARLPTGEMPPILFYLSGSLVWLYFSETLLRTSETFIANRDMLSKVYFPRLAIPVSGALSNLMQFGIQFLVFLAFYIYFLTTGAPVRPQWELFLLPFLVVQLYAYALGFGLIVASLTTKYRDLQFTLRFSVQLYMFASPIVYPAALAPQEYRWLYMLNPIAPMVESFRYMLTGYGRPASGEMLGGAIITVFFLLLGLLLFSRIERRFADTI